MKYIELEEVDSTNEYIKRNIDTLEHLTIIRCAYQSKGKGRSDHQWDSKKNDNLLMSILLKQFKDSTKVHQVTQIIAVAIVKALKSYNIDALIKWPNDIYVNDLKICGILVEAVYDTTLQGVIIGMGLNVNSQGMYQSMANCKGKHFDINEIMVRILTQFIIYYKIYLQDSYFHILDKANELSYLKDKKVKYQAYGEVVFKRLNEDGTVTIKDHKDRCYNIHCNEITLHNEKIKV